MKLVGKPILYLANFPASQAGKLADTYYKVLNDDATIYLAIRQDDLVEFGNGRYGVKIAFVSEGSWYIEFWIDGTPYVGGEEINIYDEDEVFTVHGA